MRAQEAVFRMISREIHDNIGLTLTTIKLFLHRLNPRNNTDEASYLKGSMGMLSKAIEQLRRISRSMNGDVLEDQGLVNALQQEVDQLNQLNQLQVVLRVEGEQVNFDSAREVVVSAHDPGVHQQYHQTCQSEYGGYPAPVCRQSASPAGK